MITNKKRSKLGATLAVIAGVGCAAPAANAATVFTADSGDPVFVIVSSLFNITEPGVVGELDFPSEFLGLSDVAVSFASDVMLTDTTYDVFSFIGTAIGFSQYSSVSTSDTLNSSALNRLRSDLSVSVFDVVAGLDNFVVVDLNGDGESDTLVRLDVSMSNVGAFQSVIVDSIATNLTIGPLSIEDDGSFSVGAGLAAINSVPEPSSLGLLSIGFLGLLSRRARGTVTK